MTTWARMIIFPACTFGSLEPKLVKWPKGAILSVEMMASLSYFGQLITGAIAELYSSVKTNAPSCCRTSIFGQCSEGSGQKRQIVLNGCSIQRKTEFVEFLTFFAILREDISAQTFRRIKRQEMVTFCSQVDNHLVTFCIPTQNC